MHISNLDEVDINNQINQITHPSWQLVENVIDFRASLPLNSENQGDAFLVSMQMTPKGMVKQTVWLEGFNKLSVSPDKGTPHTLFTRQMGSS